ncbi:Ohr subfamily peroxiredoxin [Kribbella antiqua]|uniref:Ohr subfamily peroxiredoxin n=1 Tax=Kribbella antiqua TaxID=2512217 RepID=A0A4R2I245_9ACTN|nr:Ohr family peroxiredoxin [Kribbella antiqua]TCO38131.1 Ohr subfamily peroxiredoxin [Kribbella antiqua]
MNPVYTASATSSGRDARAVSSDGRLDLRLAMPKEMGGTGDGTNPEQLLAAGWAACFSTVMDLIAEGRGLDAKDVAVTAEVSLVPNGPGLALAAVLRVEMPDHLRGPDGEKLLEATHRSCPYSTATQGNIPVEIIVE